MASKKNSRICIGIDGKMKTMNKNYQDMNAEIIDRWVQAGWEWGLPIDRRTYERVLHGDWQVKLTPVKFVPREWFGDITGKKVLGLASGGGQQIPLFTAAGAECTVLDYSEKQLETEATVAQREGYTVHLVRADMTKPFPFDDESFDIIFHPVSNIFVEKVAPIFKECCRVLKKGGVLLCGLDIGINYIVDEAEEKIITGLPFNPLQNEAHRQQLLKEDCGFQFSHTVSEQIGGQLQAGFILTHIEDDTNGEGRLHELYIPSLKFDNRSLYQKARIGELPHFRNAERKCI